MAFVPSQDAIMRAQTASSAFCPLRPNACPGSDKPFSAEALRAFVEYGRQVLDAHGTAPLQATRTVLSSGVSPWRGDVLRSPGTLLGIADKAARAGTGPTGAHLRQVRQAAGLDQRDVARAAGIARGTLQDLETGRRISTAAMREGVLEAIATVVRDHVPRPCLLCPGVLPLGAPMTRRYCSDRCYRDAVNTQRRERYARTRQSKGPADAQ